MTVGSEFEGKGEDVTMKLLSPLRIKMHSRQGELCCVLTRLLYLEEGLRKEKNVSLISPLACFSCADLSSTDGAELCDCVNTGDSMAWCYLGMRHPLKSGLHTTAE